MEKQTKQKQKLTSIPSETCLFFPRLAKGTLGYKVVIFCSNQQRPSSQTDSNLVSVVFQPNSYPIYLEITIFSYLLNVPPDINIFLIYSKWVDYLSHIYCFVH